jgi:hypothetical protein
LLRAVDPFLRNLNPLLTGLGLYKREVTSFFGNLSAATNGELTVENAEGQKLHFLRTLGPLNSETVSSYPNRLAINRASAYSPPEWAKGLAAGLPSFGTSSCSAGLTAELEATTPTNGSFVERVKQKKVVGEGASQQVVPLTAEEIAKQAETFFNLLKKYAFDEQSSTGSVPTPSCTQQAPLKSIYGSGEETIYQHTFEQTGR